MKTVIYILVLFVLGLFSSCELPLEDNVNLVEDTTVTEFSALNYSFDSIAKAIQGINSPYDDYNSASPYFFHHGWSFPLYFSSNRLSKGVHFDIVSSDISILKSDLQGVPYDYLHLWTSSENPRMDNYIEGFSHFMHWSSQFYLSINTAKDELGPLFINESTGYGNAFFISQSTDVGGLDIIVNYAKYRSDIYELDSVVNSQALNINTESDDAYLSISEPMKQFFFCSNRSGVFEIYEGDINESTNDWVEATDTSTVRLLAALNSPADDKCPYINGNLMVFTSDREGGFGGFDLYYSIFQDNTWSAPINFGPDINSASDEYRPISLRVGHSLNDLMIFSSNRPGGMGGFDLYYVGIDKIPGL